MTTGDRSFAAQSLDGVATGAVLAGRYRIVKELGRGGMATVYLAEDARHGRPVAVKAMHGALSGTIGVERFSREIAIAARLQHPHILPLFDSGEHQGQLYYVMPFVEGESLRDRLSKGQPLSVVEATTIAREIASALEYAHERGVVHRDIKPENILLSRGTAMVADFGIASAVEEFGPQSLTGVGLMLGSPAYMSPEQSEGDSAVDGRADIYALGCVLYEMLAGTPPFSGPTLLAILSQKLTTDPTPLRQLDARVPAHVERAVSIAMARTVQDRFGSCAAFAAALSRPAPEHLAAVELPGEPAAAVAKSRGLGVPNLGPLVSRLCDRSRQVNSFDATFRESQQKTPGRPQVHVIHGPEGGSHDSLVERIIATRLRHFASEISGEERGVVRAVRAAWPTGDDLTTRQRDLAIGLFREVSSGYMGAELSAPALMRQPSLALAPIVVIHHDLRMSAWDRTADVLLRWYVHDFWGTLEPTPQMPVAVVFLKVIYDVGPQRRPLLPWRRRDPDQREVIRGALDALLRTADSRCIVHIASELGEVTAVDVQDWFKQHQIGDSERTRQELAANMFRTSATRPMVDVEVALEEIRSEFVRQHSSERGESRW